MIFSVLLVTGLALAQVEPSKKNAYECYEMVVKNGKYPIVEAFYLNDKNQPQPLDSVVDPVISQLKTDKRISNEGREGLKKIQDDMLRAYPCDEFGVAYHPSRRMASFTYTCFPRENGVLRIESKMYLQLKEALDAINNNAGASSLVFNFYLKMASSYVYAGSKLLEKTPVTDTQIEAATRNRIKGPRSLDLTAEETKNLQAVCSTSVLSSLTRSVESPTSMPTRRRPGAR